MANSFKQFLYMLSAVRCIGEAIQVTDGDIWEIFAVNWNIIQLHVCRKVGKTNKETEEICCCAESKYQG